MSAVSTAAALGAAFLVGAQGVPAAWAEFTESATATARVAAGVLAPPTAVTATATCLRSSMTVDLSWTASATAWADGYEVLLGTSPGGPYDVVPLGSGAATDTTRTIEGLAQRTTYYLVVSSTKGGWRSPAAEVAVTGSGKSCR